MILFLCTGTHLPTMPENGALARRIQGELHRFRQAELVVHDAHQHPQRYIGEALRGTRVEISERADACAALLVVADMKYHYFAGYSNAVKYFVPGLASVETARGNHALALEPAALRHRARDCGRSSVVVGRRSVAGSRRARNAHSGRTWEH